MALYTHVPFCRARCAYCSFNTYAGLEDLMPTYGEGLRREMDAAGEEWGPLRVSKVYVGGGTSSLLPLDAVADLVDVVHATYDPSRRAEITLDANPGTVNRAYPSGLRMAEGVKAERFETRFSTGLADVLGEELTDLQQLGLVTWDGSAVRLTGRGRLLGNRVFGRFIS